MGGLTLLGSRDQLKLLGLVEGKVLRNGGLVTQVRFGNFLLKRLFDLALLELLCA